MILYTIQPEFKWQELQDTGILKAHDDIICFSNNNFIDSYIWIESKMHELLPKSDIICKHPVWAWYRYNNKSKPTLKGQITKGEIGYLIKFEIDDSKVLLSSFDKWNLVLNHSIEDLKNNKTIFALDEFNEDDIAIMLEEGFEIEDDNIVFDWNNIILNKTSFENTIQATLWHIKKEQVISYKKFKSR